MTSSNLITFDEIGLKKAAVLLMSLPAKTAARVLGQLPPRYIEAISIRSRKPNRSVAKTKKSSSPNS